jgi:hypothetical protein
LVVDTEWVLKDLTVYDKQGNLLYDGMLSTIPRTELYELLKLSTLSPVLFQLVQELLIVVTTNVEPSEELITLAVDTLSTRYLP